MKDETRRRLGWLAIGAVVVALFAWMLWPRAVPVDVAEATLGPLIVTLDEEGETRVRERYQVSAPVEGRLLRIEIEPGERVVDDGIQKLRAGVTVDAKDWETPEVPEQSEQVDGSRMAGFFVRRPIVAMVISILIVLLGLVAMQALPIA